MYAMKSTVTLGKTPPIICLDDESNVSEDEILVITIPDSFSCVKQKSQHNNEHLAPGSSATTTVPKIRQLGDTTVDNGLGTLCQLDMQRSTSKGRGSERQQFCEKFPNVGQGAISGQMPKNKLRQPSNDAKVNFKPSITTNAPPHPVDSTCKSKLVARRGIEKQQTCDKLSDVEKDAINSKIQIDTGRQPLKDNESNVSKDKILVITIQDSFSCEKQKSQHNNKHLAPVSSTTTTVSKTQLSETTVDYGLGTLCKLDKQRSTCKASVRKFCENFSNVRQSAISGQMPENMPRQPSNDAKLNFKPSITPNSLPHPVDSTRKTKLVARRSIGKQQTCDKSSDVEKDASNSKIQINTVRQPLKDAKDNSKPATTTHAPRCKIRDRTAKLLPVENFNGASLPALSHCSKINPCSLQSKHVNEAALLLKKQNNKNRGEENSKDSTSKKKKKKGKKRKADSTGLIGDDMAHPSKTIKLISDQLTKAPPSNAVKSIHANCVKEKNVAVPSIKPIIKSKAQKKKKARKKAREICKTNKGDPFLADKVHICSPTNELQNLPADESVIVIGADSRPNTTLRTELSEEKKDAPLGSCVNPIILDVSLAHKNEEKLQAFKDPIILDVSLAHKNEEKLQASKPSSKNQKEVQVDNPEIEILDMSIHASSSKNSLTKRTQTIEFINQVKPQAKQRHQPASRMLDAPTNRFVGMPNFLFGSQPAGPFGYPSNPLVPPTFNSPDNAFGIRRTVINDVRSNNFSTNAALFTGSSLQYNAAPANHFNAPLALNPAVNEGNVWTSLPFLDPFIDAAPWRLLLAEQAELYHRASINAIAMECSTSNNLRPIAIDGSNIAFSHGKDKVFSTQGIKISIDYFLKRGHVVKAFVPQYRRKVGYNVKDQPLLEKLGKSQHVVFTPSRDINGVNVACYDDRFVLEYAARTGAVIVSNDNYRDLIRENSNWKDIINTRLLMFTFADDHFMVPEDPLGRNGPRLDQFLRF